MRACALRGAWPVTLKFEFRAAGFESSFFLKKFYILVIPRIPVCLCFIFMFSRLVPNLVPAPSARDSGRGVAEVVQTGEEATDTEVREVDAP